MQRAVDLRSCDGTMWTPLFSLETEGLCDFTQCRDMTTVNLCAHDYPCNSTHSRAIILMKNYNSVCVAKKYILKIRVLWFQRLPKLLNFEYEI